MKPTPGRKLGVTTKFNYISTGPSTNPTTASATSSTTYQPPAEFCKDRKNGNNPDPTRCDGFIACVHGTAIFMKCPAKLRYNPILGVCDYKYHVECSKCKYLIFWFAFVPLVIYNLFYLLSEQLIVIGYKIFK